MYWQEGQLAGHRHRKWLEEIDPRTYIMVRDSLCMAFSSYTIPDCTLYIEYRLVAGIDVAGCLECTALEERLQLLGCGLEYIFVNRVSELIPLIDI
jgi:hypothetical protein